MWPWLAVEDDNAKLDIVTLDDANVGIEEV